MMNDGDILDLVDDYFARYRVEIEDFLVENHADPAIHHLLTFEDPPRRRLLVLVPAEVAEDVQSLPLAELRARYPHRELVFP